MDFFVLWINTGSKLSDQKVMYKMIALEFGDVQLFTHSYVLNENCVVFIPEIFC